MDILKFSIRQKINKENKIKKSNKYKCFKIKDIQIQSQNR